MFLQQSCISASKVFWKILLKNVLPIVLPTFLKYMLLPYSYHSKSHGLRTSLAMQLRKHVGQFSEEADTLSTLHGIPNCIKNGTIQKNVAPTDGSVSPQCRPQLHLDRFENLIQNILRNEDSTLEINVSLLGVLHQQQWQPTASAPGINIGSIASKKMIHWCVPQEKK